MYEKDHYSIDRHYSHHDGSNIDYKVVADSSNSM